MKVFVSVDMEGISGIYAQRQTLNGQADYSSARRLYTQDMNAVIRGAFAGGADEIVLCG